MLTVIDLTDIGLPLASAPLGGQHYAFATCNAQACGV
jgi:hypothetical protein